MANDLTGDFDVLVEFAIPAVNRVLAAMHRNERFPHSAAFHVDDRSGLPAGNNVVVAVVDTFGEPVVDHHRLGPIDPLPGARATTSSVYATLDPVVNSDLLVTVLDPGTITPTALQGRAQLQLSPPTVEIAPRASAEVVVTMEIRARYLPDPHTGPLAEFIRGELALTVAVNQLTSQVASVIDVDIKANDVGVSFTPLWSSQPLGAGDLAGINQLIRNALKTSLLPSSTPLPAAMKFLQFKTFGGATPAIAALLNMARPAPDTSVAGNPASASNVFLGAADDFAFGVAQEFIVGAFDPVISNIISQPIPPVPVDIPLVFYTAHETYTMSLQSASVALATGKITLTIQGHAHTPASWLPDFDFTVSQDFGLQANGASADLVVGELSLDTSSWIVNLFRGQALAVIGPLRDQALDQSHARDAVRSMLSADANLGGFFDSLLASARPKRVPRFEVQLGHDVELQYSSVEIRPSGVVLHGSLSVPAWPPGHAEFEPLPQSASSPVLSDLGSNGPDYSALKSWIPGGAIQRFEWTAHGQAQPLIDENRFVLLHTGPENTVAMAFSLETVTGYAPLCLTVRGSRLSSSGPVVGEAVTATICGYPSVSILNGLESSIKAMPMVTLTKQGPAGLVEITGHTPARADSTGQDTPNRIVHFADDKTTAELDFLTQAVREGRPQGAATAVLAVLPPDRLSRTRYTEGIIYLEDVGALWEAAFGVKTAQRPLTLIVDPKGTVVWQHEGPLDGQTLSAAARKHLVARGPVSLRLLGSGLRIGQPAPDFLFELVPGRLHTLRKLEGRAVVLVFWNSASRPSLEAVRDAEAASRAPGGPIVLAINDGEAPELARRVAAASRSSATTVFDPQRRISVAYGVSVWPTTVFIDAAGVVQGMKYGRETKGERS